MALARLAVFELSIAGAVTMLVTLWDNSFLAKPPFLPRSCRSGIWGLTNLSRFPWT